MGWDFSGNMPEVIVYETQANIPMRFRANLIERKTDKAGKQIIDIWNIYFDATTYEGAINRANTWWLDQRAKHDAAEEAKARRSAMAAAIREQKSAEKGVNHVIGQ